MFKKSLKLFAAAAIGLSLTACNVFDTGAKRIQTSCIAATQALNAVVPQMPTMSTERLAQVKTVKETIVDPICNSPEQPEYSDLLVGRIQQATEVFTNANAEAPK